MSITSSTQVQHSIEHEHSGAEGGQKGFRRLQSDTARVSSGKENDTDEDESELGQQGTSAG